MKYWHKINFFNNLLLYSLPFLFSSSNNFQIESLSEVQQRNRRLHKYDLSFKWILLKIFKRQICSVINFLFMTNIASLFALNNFQIKSYLKVSRANALLKISRHSAEYFQNIPRTGTVCWFPLILMVSSSSGTAGTRSCSTRPSTGGRGGRRGRSRGGSRGSRSSSCCNNTSSLCMWGWDYLKYWFSL